MWIVAVSRLIDVFSAAFALCAAVGVRIGAVIARGLAVVASCVGLAQSLSREGSEKDRAKYGGQQGEKRLNGILDRIVAHVALELVKLRPRRLVPSALSTTLRRIAIRWCIPNVWRARHVA